jgi:diaminopimelate decarboxylase
MISYRELAAEYGTPLYVYDADRLVAAGRDLQAAVPTGSRIYYAVKANPHPGLGRLLREEFDRPGAEISSTGELSAALSAGFSAGECLYTGPGKTMAEIAEAVATGVRTFSVESPGDLRRIGAVAAGHGTTVDCLLRMNGVPAGGSTSIRMTGAPSQFGFDVETLGSPAGALPDGPGARTAGMHFFPLSNAADEDTLADEFDRTAETAARVHREHGLRLEFLDLGGGFAAPYGVSGVRPRYGNLRARLEKSLDAHLPEWRDGVPRIAFESGRYLVADCGTLLTSVVNVKVSRGRRYAIVDAGINALGGMSGLGRLLPASVSAERVAPAVDGSEPMEEVRLAGPLCTPGDLLAQKAELPPLKDGDLLAIPNVGAYGLTASLLAFLGRPAPVEVVVRDGRVMSASRLEIRREATG